MYGALIILFVNFLPIISENPLKFTFSAVVRKFLVQQIGYSLQVFKLCVNSYDLRSI